MRNRSSKVICLLVATLILWVGCGKPQPGQRYRRPSEITDFQVLFVNHCSGCHGKDGQLGPAPPLNDPLFQAIISDAQLTELIRNGRSETLMPAFARRARRTTHRKTGHHIGQWHPRAMGKTDR